MINIKLLKHSEGDSTSIGLLIRNDFYYLFINRNIVKGQKNEPNAMETYLGGFILSGVFIDKNTNKESSFNFNSTHVLCITVEDNFINNYEEEKCFYQDALQGQLNKFWETKIVGKNDYTEDDKLMKRFNEELKFNKTQSWVQLPFREHHEIVPDNFLKPKSTISPIIK